MLPGFDSNGQVDVLNRFPSADLLAQTVHVMMYIFPRQFGLHNVFTSATDSRETVQPFKDYTMREDEIAQSGRRPTPSRTRVESKVSPKIPKRLRGKAVDLIQKLQNRNKRCSYVELLRHYCPSEVSLSGTLYEVLMTQTILMS